MFYLLYTNYTFISILFFQNYKKILLGVFILINPFTFSLIIPVYNVEQYLEKCLDSVVNQTCKDFETIIVNDGSTDSSSSIIDKYKNKIENLTIITQNNQGLSVARNNGIEKATGKWICFLDSDDYISHDYFEVLNQNISDNFDLIEFNYRSIDGNSSNISDIFNSEFPYFVPVNAWTKCYKKELFNNVRFPLGLYFEDFAVTPYFVNVYKVKKIDNVLYNYVVREGSIITSGKKITDIIDSLEYLLNLFKINQKTIQNYETFLMGIYYHIFLCRFGKLYSFSFSDFKKFRNKFLKYFKATKLNKPLILLKTKQFPFKRKLLILFRMYCPSWLLYSLRKMKIGV